MPRLYERNGGSHYIRHFFWDHSTWQITGDGVRLLQNRGIRAGMSFSTDTFMDLWLRGAVYHGQNGPPVPTQIRRDGSGGALEDSVTRFWTSAFNADFASAWALVASGIATQSDFSQELRLLRLTSWKRFDAYAVAIALEEQRKFGAERVGVTTTWLNVAMPHGRKLEARQFWLCSMGVWRLIWSGTAPFLEPPPIPPEPKTPLTLTFP